MWALMPLIAFFAMLPQDVGITALITTFLSGFIPLLILIASFVNKKAFWKITKFDWFCGALSLAGVAAWVVTREGNAAILFAIFADIFASVPTAIKAYRHPDTESWFNYFGGALNAFTTILTLEVLTFASVAWLLDIFVICCVLLVLIKFRIGEKFNKALV